MTKKLLQSFTFIASMAMAGTAFSSVIYSFEEIGNDVVGILSGSIDLTGLNTFSGGTFSGLDFVNPTRSFIITSPLTDTRDSVIKTNFNVSPSPFGGGIYDTRIYATSYVGDFFGVNNTDLFLHNNYSSGASLSGTLIFENTSINAMQLISGDYISTLANGETFTLSIAEGKQTSVPAPTSFALLVAGVCGLMVHRRRKRFS